MHAEAPAPSLLRFGVFELDLRTGELRKSGTLIKLPPQPARVLMLIASRPGELVTREEIQAHVWGTESFVDFEQGMNHCIKQIRNALCDNSGTPRYVETLPRRGYRFIVPVEQVRATSRDLGKEAAPLAPAPPESPAAAAEVEPRASAGLPAPVLRPRPSARRWAVLGVLAIAAISGAVWLGPGRRVFRPASEKPSIAVVPFADISPAKDQEYFADGLTDELIDALAQNPALRVAGRTSSFQFKGKTGNYRAIGNRLNVTAVLDGSVRHQGSRARITVQLVKTADGMRLWSETYERELTDIFAVEEEIARSATAALARTLLGQPAATRPLRRTSPEAHQAFLQGNYFLQRADEESLKKAAVYFAGAVQKDPLYAPAWAGVAEVCITQAGGGYAPVDDGFGKAREAAKRALELDAELGAAHYAEGWIRLLYDWDWAGADASFRRALALEPGNSRVISRAASLARALGRLNEAIGLARKATEIDPLNRSGWSELGIDFRYAGRNDEAAAAFSKALELFPERAGMHSQLSLVRVAQSRLHQALELAGQEKDSLLRSHALAVVYQALGRKREANAYLAESIDKFGKDAPFMIAELYAFRGEVDQAFQWLEKAYAERDSGVTDLTGDPLLKDLVPDPRYAAYLRKLRLPQ